VLAWRDWTGASVGRREKDLDFLAEVRSAKSQIAHLWNNNVRPKWDRNRRQRARELCGTASVACRNRGRDAKKGTARQNRRTRKGTRLSHLTYLLTSRSAQSNGRPGRNRTLRIPRRQSSNPPHVGPKSVARRAHFPHGRRVSRRCRSSCSESAEGLSQGAEGVLSPSRRTCTRKLAPLSGRSSNFPSGPHL
jgi:hypothetical protein